MCVEQWSEVMWTNGSVRWKNYRRRAKKLREPTGNIRKASVAYAGLCSHELLMALPKRDTWEINANIYRRVFPLIKFSAAALPVLNGAWISPFSSSNIWIVVFASNLNQFRIHLFRECGVFRSTESWCSAEENENNFTHCAPGLCGKSSRRNWKLKASKNLRIRRPKKRKTS